MSSLYLEDTNGLSLTATRTFSAISLSSALFAKTKLLTSAITMTSNYYIEASDGMVTNGVPNRSIRAGISHHTLSCNWLD